MPTIISTTCGHKRDATSALGMTSVPTFASMPRSFSVPVAGKYAKSMKSLLDDPYEAQISTPKATIDTNKEGELLSGFLFKKSVKGLSLWKKRWCVLTGTSIYLYKSADDKGCCEQIDITGRRVSNVIGFLKYQFVLTCSSSSSAQDCLSDPAVLFRASSDEELNKWLTALQEQLYSGSDPTTESKQKCDLCTRLFDVNAKVLHVILVRHGHYINANRKDVADENQVLSEMGRQQAHLTGKHLDQLLSTMRHLSVTVPHSDLTRASETATIIGDRFGCDVFKPCQLLREGWPGRPWPTRTCTETHVEHCVLPTEIQSKEDRRLETAFQLYFTQHIDEPDDAYRIIVCHANIIRYFICRALGVDSVGVWGQMEVNHCSLTRIDVYEDGSMKLMAMNETGHLPETLKTSSEDHL